MTLPLGHLPAKHRKILRETALAYWRVSRDPRRDLTTGSETGERCGQLPRWRKECGALSPVLRLDRMTPISRCLPRSTG
jgi:hypothetical protein